MGPLHDHHWKPHRNPGVPNQFVRHARPQDGPGSGTHGTTSDASGTSSTSPGSGSSSAYLRPTQRIHSGSKEQEVASANRSGYPLQRTTDSRTSTRRTKDQEEQCDPRAQTRTIDAARAQTRAIDAERSLARPSRRRLHHRGRPRNPQGFFRIWFQHGRRGLRLIGTLLLLSVITTTQAGPAYDPGSTFGQRDATPFTYERTFDLTQQKVIFNPIGKYAVDVTFLHMELKVNFGHFVPLFEEFKADIVAAYTLAQQVGKLDKDLKKSTVSGLAALSFPVNMAGQKLTETLYKLPEVTYDEARFDPAGRYRRDYGPRSDMAAGSDLAADPLLNQEERFTESVIGVGPDPLLTREKRFIESVIGVGSSILSFVFDIFKYQEIKGVKRDLLRLEKTQQAIYDRQKMLMQTTVAQGKLLTDHQKWIKETRDQLALVIKTDQAGLFTKLLSFGGIIQREVDTFADTVKMALLGKLNPDQISYEKLTEMAQFVWDMEKEKGLQSPVKIPADLFSMPLSYLYNLEEERLEFIFHIPMTQPHQILDMYEYLPFPMSMTNDRHRVAVPRPGPHNVLAYNQKREFQTLSASELQACFVLKKVHYCARRQVLRTDWTKTCLSALFVKNQEASTRYCDFQIQPADERVFKLQGSDFLIYTNRDLITERICGDRHEQVHVKEGSVVSVPQGCRLKLEQHQIYGEVGLHRGFETPQIFEWTWDAQRVLRNHSGPDLVAAIAAMEHEAGMLSFETEDLLQQMELNRLEVELNKTRTETLDLSTSLNNPFGWVHWVSAVISCFTTFISTMMFLGFLRWIRRRQLPAPSAPGLLPVVYHQPQPPMAPNPVLNFVAPR